MVIEGCNCEEGLGVWHDHERRFVVTEEAGRKVAETVPTGWVRVWVPWKKVARALLLIDGGGS